MEVFHCIKKRRSVRKYSDKPIEWGKVIDILDSGRLAPSAGNLQNWKFILVTNKCHTCDSSGRCPHGYANHKGHL